MSAKYRHLVSPATSRLLRTKTNQQIMEIMVPGLTEAGMALVRRCETIVVEGQTTNSDSLVGIPTMSFKQSLRGVYMVFYEEGRLYIGQSISREAHLSKLLHYDNLAQVLSPQDLSDLRQHKIHGIQARVALQHMNPKYRAANPYYHYNNSTYPTAVYSLFDVDKLGIEEEDKIELAALGESMYILLMG